MRPFSQIVEINASDFSHNLGDDGFLPFSQNVRMDNSKNGGPNYLEAWRRYRGLTQEQLAEKLGTTSSVISYLEQGERGLSAKWLRKLAPVLGTTPGMILDHDPAELDNDVIDMWAHASLGKRRQIAEITRTIMRDGTKG